MHTVIKDGKVRGNGIDVHPQEPPGYTDDFAVELQCLPTVILTPYIGGSTQEAQRNIAEFVPSRIIQYVNTGNSTMSVNSPNLDLPELEDAHRIIHTHKNVPGILTQVNAVLAKRSINIVGQYLKTNEHIGYAITDINNSYDKNIIPNLKKIPHTIEVRILH